MHAAVRPRRPALEVTGLSLARGGKTLVERLDFTLRPGRIHWICGGNGSGKTSLLRVLAGVDAPDSGRVLRRTWGGAATVGWVAAGMRLPPSAHPQAWLRLIRAGDRSVLSSREISGLLPNLHCGQRVIRVLSTGEEKRLVLLAALLRPTAFLFLDEPLAHLSGTARGCLMEILAREARDRVVVLASHLEAAPALLDGQRIQLSGDAWAG